MYLVARFWIISMSDGKGFHKHKQYNKMDLVIEIYEAFLASGQ